MTRNRILAVLLLAALALAVLAPAALASTTGVASFTGNARVGHWFRSDQPCGKEGTGVPEGEGLYLPLVVERDRSGVWRLDTTFVFSGVSRGATLPLPVPGLLDVCGQLDHEAAGLGAACGASKGFAGRGRLAEDGVPQRVDLKLFNVGWKEALGGVLPVTGNYQEYGVDGSTKGKVGTFVALVRVAPGSVDQPDSGVLACAGVSGNGAKAFAASGVVAFLGEALDVGKQPDGKQCRADGPADKAGPVPDVTDCPQPGPGK